MKYVDEYRDGEVRPSRAEQGPHGVGMGPRSGKRDLALALFLGVGSMA